MRSGGLDRGLGGPADLRGAQIGASRRVQLGQIEVANDLRAHAADHFLDQPEVTFHERFQAVAGDHGFSKVLGGLVDGNVTDMVDRSDEIVELVLAS